MGARPDRADHLVGFGGREDELDVRRRLLDHLQQGVETRRGDHVRLVDDIDLVAAGDRREERPLPQVAGIVHPAVRSGVDLDHVDRPGTATGQVAAGRATAARHRGRTFGAVQRPGQDPGRCGLATAAGAREQVRVIDPVVGQRPLQRFGDVLLADDVGEGVRTVAPVQRQRGVGTLHRDRIRQRARGWPPRPPSPRRTAGHRGRARRGRRRTGPGRPARRVRVRRAAPGRRTDRPRARRPRVNHTCWAGQFSTRVRTLRRRT